MNPYPKTTNGKQKMGMKRTIKSPPYPRPTSLKKIKEAVAKYPPMKRTPIKKVSKKQAKRNHELAKIEPPADGRCEECHELPDFRGLAKHHKLFRSHGGKDNDDNLIWLCGKCHSKAHGIKEI